MFRHINRCEMLVEVEDYYKNGHKMHATHTKYDLTLCLMQATPLTANANYVWKSLISIANGVMVMKRDTMTVQQIAENYRTSCGCSHSWWHLYHGCN